MKWDEQQLGSIAEVLPGFAFKSSEMGIEGYQVIRIGDIDSSGRVDGNAALRIPPSLIEPRHAKYFLKRGDIVLSMTGEGKLGMVVTDEPLLLNQRVARIRAYDPTDQKFLKFALATTNYAESFAQLAAGAAQQNISGGQLESLLIPIPSVDIRARIADIAVAYDDLIENNRRRMALLEESARLLYREWFVHLRFPGQATARFSDGIPEGWRKVVLGAICEAVRETVSPDEVEPDTPYIGLEHMPRRSISLGEWDTAEKVTSNKFRYREGDILFGKIRPYFHKVGIAFTDGIASSDAIVMRAKEEKHAALLLMTVSSDPFVADAAQSMREGSKMPRADWKQMTCYPVLLPPDGLLQQFSETIRATTDQLKTLTFQTQKLKTARDLLLPKLMSGEIEV